MIRNQYFFEEEFFEMRLKVLQIRAEFDKHKNIKDTRKAKVLLLRAEQDFENKVHPYMRGGYELLPFTKDTGISYGRNELFPDSVLDHWDPLEKACYPKFFARREQMKDEYIALWKKKMIKPTVHEPHSHDH